jgi:hypothetical protein
MRCAHIGAYVFLVRLILAHECGDWIKPGKQSKTQVPVLFGLREYYRDVTKECQGSDDRIATAIKMNKYTIC